MSDRTFHTAEDAIVAVPMPWDASDDGRVSAHETHTYDGRCAICRFPDMEIARCMVIRSAIAIARELDARNTPTPTPSADPRRVAAHALDKVLVEMGETPASELDQYTDLTPTEETGR